MTPASLDVSVVVAFTRSALRSSYPAPHNASTSTAISFVTASVRITRNTSDAALVGHHVLSSVLHWGNEVWGGAVMAFVYPAASARSSPRRPQLFVA